MGSSWYATVDGPLSSKEFSKLLWENSMALSLISILSAEKQLNWHFNPFYPKESDH